MTALLRASECAAIEPTLAKYYDHPNRSGLLDPLAWRGGSSHFLGESANPLVVEWRTGTTIADSVVDGVDLHARHHDWQ